MVESRVMYTAVGFRVDVSRSVFYFKEPDLYKFLLKLLAAILEKDPDFVSLRMVKEVRET